MAQQATEIGEIEEGTTVELRYEKHTRVPAHHDTVRKRTVTVEKKSEVVSVVELSNGKTEYRVHGGEVFAREIDGHFSHGVKVGDLLEITPT